MRARWGGGRRWSAMRIRALPVLYNPRTHGECLFAVLQFIIDKSGGGNYSTKSLRKMVKGELLGAVQRGDLIHGHTVQHWARQINLSVPSLVKSTTGRSRRWRNTLDLVLLAKLFDIGIRVIDKSTGKTIAEHRDDLGKMWLVGYGAYHFTVLRPATCSTLRQGPANSFSPSRPATPTTNSMVKRTSMVEGGAGGNAAVQHTPPPRRGQKRPFPLAPVFNSVQAFPPPDLSRVIDTTAYYVAHAGEEFQRRVAQKS
eukprot:4801587-Amphidinium_carterae.1